MSDESSQSLRLLLRTEPCTLHKAMFNLALNSTLGIKIIKTVKDKHKKACKMKHGCDHMTDITGLP